MVEHMDSIIHEEREWLRKLFEGDELAFQKIFYRYYEYLVLRAYHILHDEEKSKDMVQDVFFDFWKKRKELRIEGSLKAYLRKSVVNRAIDTWRSGKRMQIVQDHPLHEQPNQEVSGQQNLEHNELQIAINKAIDSLPERCRQVFLLSRFENMSHKEISESLDISTKTIENHMTKALRTIRRAIGLISFILAGVWIISIVINSL